MKGMRMAAYLVSGIVFGLSSGLAPGPLLTLVLTETLRHGKKGGTRVAFAPLITDLPIVILSLLVIAHLTRTHLSMGIISLFGAGFVVFLGYETFFSPGIEHGESASHMRSLRRGVAVNLLNPHPYLFWMAVGSPIVIRAYHEGMPQAVSFVVGFYLMLVGSKVMLALLTASARHLLLGRAYRLCMKGLGIILWLFAAVLAWDAVGFLAS